MSEFNELQGRNQLADFLGIRRSTLTYILYVKRTENLYTFFTIPKRNGDSRPIHAPKPSLKSIQKLLAYALWKQQIEVHRGNNISNKLSHAFEKGKSIITNAKVHRNKRYVLNIDLEDFFDSFHFGRVKGFFEKNRDFQVSSEVAIAIAQLACYNGHLPQGAPSSPIITNLICQILDIRLYKMAKAYKLDFTRYADDLTFSTNNKHFLDEYDEFMQKLNDIISRAGFRINADKTRLQYCDSQQKVTGLVVNKKIGVDKTYVKATRAMAHSQYTKGEFEINGELGTMNQLEGRFAFIDQIEHENNKHDREPHSIFSLNHREKQYQKFLYYRYFQANSKPLVVTEGITDSIHIKAALKKLYSDYPKLVTKNDTEYEFHIAFLRKSERFHYFLGLSETGADSMKNIFNFYSEKDNRNFKNYSKYFTKLGTPAPDNPVILLFDNEVHGDKPLEKLMKYTGNKERIEQLSQTDLFIKLSGNLYLLTIPLVDGKDECEIEDLHDTTTLSHVIEGRRFSPKPKGEGYYGKVDFANYVQTNYKTIDFSKFRPLLDKLTEINEIYRAM